VSKARCVQSLGEYSAAFAAAFAPAFIPAFAPAHYKRYASEAHDSIYGGIRRLIGDIRNSGKS
jgi:hypothetical protein